MLVIPAIDLMGGEAVRLEKGDFATKKVYAKDPAAKAAEFRDAGATLLHVVDLDGARAGRPVNLDAVAAICRVKGIEVELGGGLRTLEDVEKVLALGASYAVLGTAAVERLSLVEEACRKFPGRVRTGIDARDGEVKVAGWLAGTGLSAVEVARRVKAAGVSLVEYTDVGRDGMFTGVDAAGAARLAAEAGVEVVASGGVAGLADVKACRLAGLAGVIVGKALYEGRLDLADAIGAMPDFPDMLEAVARARELDAFASDHDAQLAVHLRSRSVAWSVGYIQQHAARHGFVAGMVPGRLVLPGAEEGAPPVLTLSFDSQAALADDPNQAALRDVTLSFDVPQTDPSGEPFVAWQASAQALSLGMDAAIVDDNGNPISAEGFAVIGGELTRLYDELAARDFAAGSAAARRLFS